MHPGSGSLGLAWSEWTWDWGKDLFSPWGFNFKNNASLGVAGAQITQGSPPACGGLCQGQGEYGFCLRLVPLGAVVRSKGRGQEGWRTDDAFSCNWL